MLQYFYLICHTDFDGVHFNDKIFLQEEKAINWGRREATKNQQNFYFLQRCPITTKGIIENNTKPIYSYDILQFGH